MYDANINNKTIEVCRKVLERRHAPRDKGNSSECLSECVVLCKRSGPNTFDIKKGIAKINGKIKELTNNQIIISRSTKMIFIVD